MGQNVNTQTVVVAATAGTTSRLSAATKAAQDAKATWVLITKVKATGKFKVRFFNTWNDKEAVSFINGPMKAAKEESFVSLQSTDRISAYLKDGTVMKLFQTNLNAMASRKVPTMDGYQSEFKAIMKNLAAELKNNKDFITAEMDFPVAEPKTDKK